MKKKAIIFGAVGVLIVGLIIFALFYFLGKTDQPKEPDTNQPNQQEEIQQPEVKNEDPKPSAPTKSYYDDFQDYSELQGITFKLPKQLMSEAIPSTDVEGSINGKTVSYSTDNTFAIKKMGSFMFGISYFEKPGVYDSSYVSTITLNKSIDITEDMKFDFNNIMFNSTSFVSSTTGKQRTSVISITMTEPGYENQKYKGYMVLVVNPDNCGYLALVATTETEYDMLAVQTIVNNMVLNGNEVYFVVPPTYADLSIVITPAENTTFVSGKITLTNKETTEKIDMDITEKDGMISAAKSIVEGTYTLSGTAQLKNTDETDAAANVVFSEAEIILKEEPVTLTAAIEIIENTEENTSEATPDTNVPAENTTENTTERTESQN